MAKPENFRIDTNTAQLHIEVSRQGRKPRPLNTTDEPILHTLAAEAKRIVDYLHSIDAKRDIEIIFITTPVKVKGEWLKGGLEYSYPEKAIHINIYVYERYEDEPHPILREDDLLLFMLRHELGHACHDLFQPQFADKWPQEAREWYANAFAIIWGSDNYYILQSLDGDATIEALYMGKLNVWIEYVEDFLHHTLNLKFNPNRMELLASDNRLMYVKSFFSQYTKQYI